MNAAPGARSTSRDPDPELPYLNVADHARDRGPAAETQGGPVTFTRPRITIASCTELAGHAPVRRGIEAEARVLVRGSQSVSWVVKSAGELKVRPGRKLVSR